MEIGKRTPEYLLSSGAAQRSQTRSGRVGRNEKAPGLTRPSPTPGWQSKLETPGHCDARLACAGYGRLAEELPPYGHTPPQARLSITGLRKRNGPGEPTICSWPFGSRSMTPAMSCSSAMTPDGGFGQPTWPRHCSGCPPQNWRLSRSKMSSALTCWSIVRTDRESE